MTVLTVAYDADCELCIRARSRLEREPLAVPLLFVAAGSTAAITRFPGVPVVGSELVVGDELGNVWIGPRAFIMCLWATRRYRALAQRLSRGPAAAASAAFFEVLSAHRHTVDGLLSGEPECSCSDDPHDPRPA